MEHSLYALSPFGLPPLFGGVFFGMAGKASSRARIIPDLWLSTAPARGGAVRQRVPAGAFQADCSGIIIVFPPTVFKFEGAVERGHQGGRMKSLRIVFLVFCVVGAGAAFSDEGSDHPADLRCKRVAEKFFEKRWGDGMIPGTETATAAIFTHHLNARQGKCFVLVDVKTSSHVKKKSASNHSLMLYDLSEGPQGKELAVYEEEKDTPRLGKTQQKITCTVNEHPCGSESEFEAMVKPYMED